ncbi:hypothetical protein Cdeb_03074 [Caldibacillus debilis GB1]|jgi:hypothetical protein|uniref:Uncharacterized protein n=1 Tax=Caldibacillus debilis GB1 TaxID=1339248 RepID=A0A420VI86_9BACI|nr:hypothetical protein Cdeb_03074 [Caldibacillus debilis GB1]
MPLFRMELPIDVFRSSPRLPKFLVYFLRDMHMNGDKNNELGGIGG